MAPLGVLAAILERSSTESCVVRGSVVLCMFEGEKMDQKDNRSVRVASFMGGLMRVILSAFFICIVLNPKNQGGKYPSAIEMFFWSMVFGFGVGRMIQALKR